MKTLYINISGKSIRNSEDIIVVGTPDDAIVDKFYYELGKEIVKGVDAPGIRGLAKHVVKSFKDIDEMSFDIITKQWLKVKDKLLGDNPTGSETIELPMEYVKWLQNYGDASHTEIAKSLYARNCLVEISLDKIYRNSVNIIINCIEPDNYGQFVVNDEVVTDDSAISTAIMKKFDGIAFKSYKKEDVCPKCCKNPCECPKICPKCGKSPCECKQNQIFAVANYDSFSRDDKEKFDFVYQLYDVTGHLIDNRHFLRIFSEDDFGKDRSMYYNIYNHLIPTGDPSRITNKIRPLLGYCVEDNFLYLITKESVMRICDYSGGKCEGEGDLYWGHNSDTKTAHIEGKFIIITEYDEIFNKKGNSTKITVYEIKENKVICRGVIDQFRKWIFDQNKYNYIQDHYHISPICIDSHEKIVFNGHKSAYYLGTNTNGQDLFIVEPQTESGKGEWPIMTKDGSIVGNMYFEGIKSISSDHKFLILRNHMDRNLGLSSIEGKMIVGQQYFNIEETEKGIFKLENHRGKTEYYFPKDNTYCKGIFKDFIWKNDTLLSFKTNNVIINDCKFCSHIMTDLYYYIDLSDKGWIINKNGVKISVVDAILVDGKLSRSNQSFRIDTKSVMIEREKKIFLLDEAGNINELQRHMYKSFTYGVALYLSKEDTTIRYCKTDGIIREIPWYNKERITDLQMFADNVVLVKIVDRRFKLETQYLVSLDGKEILDQQYHGKYTDIIKISEEFFTAVDPNGECGVYDMKGNVIMKPACKKIVLI